MGYATPRKSPTVIQTARGLVGGRTWGAYSASEAGIDLTGATDVSTALAAFINDLPTGSVLMLPAGTYRLSSSLTITRGDITIEGAERGVTLKPDAELSNPVRFLGTTEAHLERVSIRGVTIDGSAGSGSGWGTIRFDYVDGISVSDVHGDSVNDLLWLANCTQFQVSNCSVTGSTAGLCAAFDTHDGIFTNLLCTDAAEVIDFHNCSDILVSGVIATAPDGGDDEAFDIGGGTRIVIDNARCNDYYRGVTVKVESEHEWSHVTVRNSVFDNVETHGISVSHGDASSETPCTHLRVENVRITGAGGVSIVPTTDIPEFENITLSGLDINVTGVGVLAYGVIGLGLRDSDIHSSGDRALHLRGSGRITSDPIVSGNRLSSDHTSLDAVRIENTVRPRVERNDVTAPNCTGIQVSNNVRPRVVGNVIHDCGQHGLLVSWTNDNELDNDNDIIGAVVMDNEVRDWGLDTTGRLGLYVTITNVSGTYNSVVVSGNYLHITDDATLQSQVGISFAKGSLTAIDYVKFDNNLTYRVPQPDSGTGNLGANSTLENNTKRIVSS